MAVFVLPVILFSLVISDSSVFAKTQLSDSNILSGLKFGSMKTFIKARGEVLHLGEDAFVPGNILYSDGNMLMTTDGKTSHVIAGSVTGYAEGVSTQAKFTAITGFLQRNSTHVLIVDIDNHCLRFISRLSNQTTPFVGTCTSRGLRDGYYMDARFYSPWSVIKDINSLETVIVSEMNGNALRSVGLKTGEVKTLVQSLPDDPFGAVYNSNREDLIIVLRHSLGKFNTKTSTFTALTDVRNKAGLDGDFSTGSFRTALGIVHIHNDLYIVADQDSNKLRIVNIKNRTIVSVCGGARASDDGMISNCSLNKPKSLLLKSGTLYIGEYQSIRSIPVEAIQDCEDRLVELTAEEKVKCIEIIPGYDICYPPGSFHYKLYGKSCSITVTKEVKNATCPDGVYEVADTKTLKAKVQLAEGHYITLMVGKHMYNRQISDNQTCEITVHVLDPRLKQRLDLSANYQLSCAMMEDFKGIILSVAKMRYNQIKSLISRYCNQSADQEVVMTCKHDVLTVVWPTDCLFQSNSVKDQQGVVAAVKKYFGKTEFHILELFVPTHIPPILAPIINQEGLSVTATLTPLCTGGLTYMNATQTCQ